MNAIGGIAFGLFCVFVVGCGVFYIAAQSQTQPVYTDTYGNTLTQQTNDTMNASSVAMSTGESSVLPLILIVGAIFVCCVIFLIYLASKAYF
jgi:hypothetical protein